MNNFRIIILLFMVGNGFAAEKIAGAAQELFTQEEFQTYCRARRVADIIAHAEWMLGQDPELPLAFGDRQKPVVDNLSPEKLQVSQGLGLSFISGAPDAICTPWGQWFFTTYTSKSMEKGSEGIIQEAYINTLERLGVILKLINTQEGELKEQYALTRVECIELPEVEIKSKKNDPEEFSACKRKWEAMTQKYEAEKNK